MSTTESAKKWGGLGEVELGLVIGVCGLVILLAIILITVYCVCCTKKNKKNNSHNESPRVLEMQTERTVNGQNMQQVIIKNPPNGNLDRTNHNDIPYRTMDSGTHTVRYDTEPDEVDSGTGASPTRMSVDVHGGSGGQENPAYAQDEEAPPPVQTTSTESAADIVETPYGYYKPPSPVSQPPPLTPGTPITDLDEDELELPPLPPPLPPTEDYLYAEVNKSRNPEPTTSIPDAAGVPDPPSNSDQLEEMARQVWRPRSAQEIEIIEKSTF